jgi:hypothetical protein
VGRSVLETAAAERQQVIHQEARGLGVDYIGEPTVTGAHWSLPGGE